jgi:hypothetical protein
MSTFANLDDALRYVVNHLMPRRHRYIVDVRGPDRLNAGQFVDEARVSGGPGVGLTLYLAFYADSGEAEAHVRFRACPISSQFEFVPWEGIPCYAARFGCDVEAAIRTHWLMASSVYYNADAMDFECTVYDEGRLT